MSKRTELIGVKVTPETKEKFLKIKNRLRRTESWLANEYIVAGVARDERKRRRKRRGSFMAKK